MIKAREFYWRKSCHTVFTSIEGYFGTIRQGVDVVTGGIRIFAWDFKIRYDCLKAAIDILHDENTGYLQMVKQIEETYEKANKESYGFQYSNKEKIELDRLLKNMPQEAWMQ